jgi:hypothetical protein
MSTRLFALAGWACVALALWHHLLTPRPRLTDLDRAAITQLIQHLPRSPR